LGKVSPEQLAVAFLRQQLASRPVPEETSSVSLSGDGPKSKRRDKRENGPAYDPMAPREPRGPDMVGGVWFTLSLGRKHRADPKWLLPMICKAGGVTKREVGSIKIDDTETRFEIAADKADEFAQHLKRGTGLERGVTIAPTGRGPSKPPRAKEGYEPKPKFKPRPKREAGPGDAPRPAKTGSKGYGKKGRK